MHYHGSDDHDAALVRRSPGRAVLTLLPVVALHVGTVHLGGGLDDPPLSGIGRIRTWWAQR